jgi:hypothetical protein
VLHQQASTELEQGLTVAVGQLIEDGPPGGIGKGLEYVQDDSIGKYLLACQGRRGHLRPDSTRYCAGVRSHSSLRGTGAEGGSE